MRSKAFINCYCAFCRSPRTVYSKKRVSFINFVQALGTALALSFVFWQELNVKALFVFSVTLVAIEIGIAVRRLMSMPCRVCGFNPLLYIQNPDSACSKVKTHLQARQNNPDAWLSQKPIHLPVKTIDRTI